jgi:hypothetical protein
MLSQNPTKQEIFDFGLVEILKQGKASIRTEPRGCLYKNEDGNNCIVGKMLPKDFIVSHLHLNGASITSLIQKGILPEELDWMSKDDMPGFLMNLQSCHDAAALDPKEDWRIYEGSEFVERFKDRMKTFASKRHLIYKEPVL